MKHHPDDAFEPNQTDAANRAAAVPFRSPQAHGRSQSTGIHTGTETAVCGGQPVHRLQRRAWLLDFARLVTACLLGLVGWLSLRSSHARGCPVEVPTCRACRLSAQCNLPRKRQAAKDED